ncbi:MAG: DinB family protein [Candidatus Hodarchaeota archaeon]
MVYELQEAIDILSRTPQVLQELLGGLADSWVNFHKHDLAFSPSEVIGHLIAGEQTDWIPRMQIMLSSEGSKEFPPFDREGFDKHLGLAERLSQFAALRTHNLEILKASVTVTDLHKTGIHPDFGEVTLKQHLATWVVHDLTHLFQITEALALRYKNSVGPWAPYLRLLNV